MSTMVYPRDEKLEKLSQEDIISNTKLVMQGLEALKNEHNSILHSLMETIKCLKKDEEANLVHEKSGLIRKSVEMIELGLGEAQVHYWCITEAHTQCTTDTLTFSVHS
ncbi:kinesin light chain 4 [Rhinoraja longicauda]